MIFAALFCFFVKKLSFSQHTFFLFTIHIQYPVFSRILLFSERNNELNFPWELLETRLLESKGTEEHIAKKRSLSPIIKLPLQNSCQESTLRIGIKYSRQYTFIFPEVVFPRERKNRKNFIRELAEARLMGGKVTEDRFYSVTKVPLQNNCFFM